MKRRKMLAGYNSRTPASGPRSAAHDFQPAAYGRRLRAQRVRSLLVVAGVVIAAVGVRAHAGAQRLTLTYDEAISFLSATCHQDSYHRVDFGTAPVEAGKWKRFFEMEDRFCFQRIQADLVRHDFHPPLYFWLLHSWSLVFGVKLWAGLALNILIAALTTIVLFGLARRTGSSEWIAGLVAFTFAVNPAVLSVSLEMRQYDLAAFLAVLAVSLTVKESVPNREPAWPGLAALTLTIAAGSLSHYHFVLVWPLCLVLATTRLFPEHRRCALLVSAAVLAGVAVALLVHPPFEQFHHLSRRMAEFVPYPFSRRWDRALGAVAGYSYAPRTTLAFCVALIALSVLRRGWVSYARDVRIGGAWPLLFFVGIAVPIVGLYLLGSSPPHAMGPKYLSLAAPFLAFVPALLLRLVPQRLPALLYVSLTPFLFGLVIPLVSSRPHAPALPDYLANSDLILIDSTEPGHLLPVVWRVPDDRPVLAVTQDRLVDRAFEWLPHVGPSSVYLSRISYDTRREKTERILYCLHAEGFEIEPAGAFGFGPVYRLQRARPASGSCSDEQPAEG